MINVTKTYLPKKEEFDLYMDQIWESNWVTSFGPLHQQLNKNICSYLKSTNLVLINNGTIALQIAFKALELEGEVITTPFTYIATTSSLIWQNLEPVFVDIEPNFLGLDPSLIEEKITSKTSAILATHVFGTPCEIEAIELIAKKHNLKVIYDAAHCFGVNYKGQCLFNFGDISTASFQATKVFHTIDGGGIFIKDEKLLHKSFYLGNFGHNGKEKYWGAGINAKMSEFHAAMGLCVLNNLEEIIESRKNASLYYEHLIEKEKLCLKQPQKNIDASYNYSYFPVLFSSEKALKQAVLELNQNSIFPRRYFYPSLNTLHFVKKQKAPISEDISSRILCLPLFYNISKADQELIIRLIKKVL